MIWLLCPSQFRNTTIYICTEQIIRSDCITNLVQNLEQCWYISPHWGQQIPSLLVSLLEVV
ncbi:DUF1392 family protein [Nostoc sp. LEGE 12447]|uniref:DUF1392 family protein n=1 Tax=Nostoc sp. LEGE 12447 TaxID=1828640 RepID=UPI002AD29EE9|nr:DUF1392 family protein [Nostoc sp. LEGE 12447]